MQNQWTLQDAKNQFSKVVNAACAGTPQMVTKYGQPSVVIISSETYKALQQVKDTQTLSFGEFLLTMPKQSHVDECLFERSNLSLREIEF